MKNLLILLVLVLSQSIGFAEDSPKMSIEGRVTSFDGTKLKGVKIVFYNEDRSSVVKEFFTGDNGKYAAVDLLMGETYIMEVSLKGYVTKRILIDSKENYYEEDSPLIVPLDIPFQLDSNKSLTKRKELKKKGFYIGKLKVDPATGGLAVDMKFTSEQKQKYESHKKK
ncbi:MAG: carboxypeptidase regulatory-like domain-containing protein [Flavobacteriales bacterium]|nr:carboxypeptidase regulatory-like domain-containing protein [Flavobacteriales bacterium]